MAKPPSDLPVVGDRVELRGRGCEGTLILISEVELPGRTSQWACVQWTKGMGPRVVHLHELKRLEKLDLDQ